MAEYILKCVHPYVEDTCSDLNFAVPALIHRDEEHVFPARTDELANAWVERHVKRETTFFHGQEYRPNPRKLCKVLKEW